MKRSILSKNVVYVLLFLFISQVFSQDLKIATFNCEWLVESRVHVKFGLPYNLKTAKDNGIISELVFNQWSDPNFRKEKLREASNAVAKHIISLNVDVIGLTEVGKKSSSDILIEELEQLGNPFDFNQLGDSKDPTGQHVLLLSKHRLKDIKESFPNRGLYYIESDKDDVKETGLSKAMKAKITVNGEDINIILVHFKSERGGQESDNQRIKQAELIREITIKHLLKNENVIIMGDINSERNHEALSMLRGFNDIYQELIQTGDFKYMDKNSIRWTYSFQGVQDQIDHILMTLNLSKKFKPSNGIVTKIIETKDHFISDHNAVVVRLTFR